jgi:hypothetical protein
VRLLRIARIEGLTPTRNRPFRNSASRRPVEYRLTGRPTFLTNSRNRGSFVIGAYAGSVVKYFNWRSRSALALSDEAVLSSSRRSFLRNPVESFESYPPLRLSGGTSIRLWLPFG